jgi:hypothetical protein
MEASRKHLGREGCEQAVDVGGSSSQRDQAEHVQAAVDDGRAGALE